MSSFKDSASWLLYRCMQNITADLQGLPLPHPYTMVAYDVHWTHFVCITEHRHFDRVIPVGEEVKITTTSLGTPGEVYSLQYFKKSGESVEHKEKMVFDDEVINS